MYHDLDTPLDSWCHSNTVSHHSIFGGSRITALALSSGDVRSRDRGLPATLRVPKFGCEFPGGAISCWTRKSPSDNHPTLSPSPAGGSIHRLPWVLQWYLFRQTLFTCEFLLSSAPAENLCMTLLSLQYGPSSMLLNLLDNDTFSADHEHRSYWASCLTGGCMVPCQCKYVSGQSEREISSS